MSTEVLTLPAVTFDPEWQSDAALAQIESRMDNMDALASSYAVPILSEMKAEYGRYKCGVGSILLADLISEDTGIPKVPCNKSRQLECLETDLFMRNGVDEHTLLRYNTGKGFSMTFDLVYQLLWWGVTDEAKAMAVERHYDHLMYKSLRSVYGLESALYGMVRHPWGFWDEGKFDASQDLINLLYIMNGPDVFEDAVKARSGAIIDIGDVFGQRLARVRQRIRAQIPAGTLSLERPRLQ